MSPVQVFIDLAPKVIVCMSHPLNLHLAFHHKLIGFADTELQEIVVAQCDEALYQSSVLLCILIVTVL